ncbi:haloacid dehalogenase superfamily, subfamily IA, variant 3 with third motif having DD or ED/haloacid dehalogenase superfamily, subfamily IA, variant 1 with third motif having Dx(3-4)D or Dx(3-4)E [Archaeoglobus sulfaticallidus PM70-1]|uniref:Haloacid dehalogenase superfamily, subfamily IA, variant 3 with third motif having DD or ED/haloacid dehalogenase superfamily, subfamily IA, variant 1 with third motif having Dx(3-4)D or Dx(3-4)E n=1 Tax=Archaeoglobus sulfaticallidus PM70-1 TaxID=387631 RepID=N0BLM5_9EURY|nr:HAD family hydrolase [Archaeoglobus sulfaticallidus]AGK61120.1 haloacid dehalogenase superfamily, subfamily IA, variant 3 with third motif having DD or ED/haloacid dehalogenase superfamily, subfamily IA, variant 1 with third motif having Dx(3-4)D or Dx(3-4)E [Archaeoglobus sulfaticallidus PM70-1]
MIRNIAFDLDGTLTYFNLPFDRIRKEIGIKEGFVLENIMSLNYEERMKKLEVLKRYEIDSVKNARLMDGVLEIIEFIESKNIKKGIVTRNCKESAEIFSKKFGIDFDYIISREEVTPKPSPLPVILSMIKTNSRPDETMMVGDFKFDLLAGKLAGVKTVLLRTEKNADFIDGMIHLADHIISSLTEIKKLVD